MEQRWTWWDELKAQLSYLKRCACAAINHPKGKLDMGPPPRWSCSLCGSAVVYDLPEES